VHHWEGAIKKSRNCFRLTQPHAHAPQGIDHRCGNADESVTLVLESERIRDAGINVVEMKGRVVHVLSNVLFFIPQRIIQRLLNLNQQVPHARIRQAIEVQLTPIRANA